MITVEQAKKEKIVGEGVAETATFFGLSTDAKPAVAANGSAFIEMDTSKAYFYDADGAQWLAFGGADDGNGD